jgi:hypothetical protein
MSDPWVPLVLAAVAVVGAAWFLRPRRAPDPEPSPFADAREEQLARRVARMVGSSAEDVLPAVRRELEYSPHQSDDTLARRAAYHYRQELPERSCPVYRDRARG